ncbi:hypothetical protein B0H11DRAFT_1900543 [Mycena galericulata]|nr:hypothetical protein B0H11DRAFT_1900543 [Mycena galericulata]
MFISLPLISAAIAVLSRSTGVGAVPKPADDLVGRGNPSCSAGFYYSTTAPAGCRPCPQGNTCSGSQQPQPCDYGTFQNQTGQTFCYQTQPGYFQYARGQNTSLPCAAGSYQPYARQSFCYNAPNGRWQPLTGQPKVCGVCCGWFTNGTDPTAPGNPVQGNPSQKTTGITKVYKCPANAPYSGSSSGDGASGCSSRSKGCTPFASCVVPANGTCPDQTFSG